ncbi:MAG: hypothetical protein ACP5JC_00825 [Candidatus Micrarchaeia archaeon]
MGKNRMKNFIKGVAIVGAIVFANKQLEAKTYDDELTKSVAQILDTRYANDTTEIGRKWKIISVKEDITAKDVYDFLHTHWDAREYVEEVCPTCVLGLAEVGRRQNLQKDDGGGNGGVNVGTSEQVKPQTSGNDISEEARDFFNRQIYVGEKKMTALMTALEYLINCGYLPGEIEAIYKKIKSDWGSEKVNLNTEFLDSYAKEVTGRVLPYPSEKPEPMLTQEQRDSLGGWAFDTLNAVFSESLGATGKHWKAYLGRNDKEDLDAIYNFCLTIQSICNDEEGKVVSKVMKEIHPYTKDFQKTKEQMNRN